MPTNVVINSLKCTTSIATLVHITCTAMKKVEYTVEPSKHVDVDVLVVVVLVPNVEITCSSSKLTQMHWSWWTHHYGKQLLLGHITWKKIETKRRTVKEVVELKEVEEEED